MAAVASAPALLPTPRREQREDPLGEWEEETQKLRSVEELYSSYLGMGFAAFLAFLPKSALSLVPTLQCRNQYLSLRLRQAEEQLAGLKSRRQEDSKANARVVEIFASHRNAWQKEERGLIQQIDESNEEIARLQARIGELERNENVLLAEIEEMKREIGERDELLNFMSMKTTSSVGDFDGFGGSDGGGYGKYGGLCEARVSEGEEKECIGGERGMDADVGLLLGHSNGGSGFDPNFLSSMAAKFWSERANPWQDVQYTTLDTTYHTKHFVARRESPWKVDGDSTGVPSKLKVLEQELLNLERLGKGDFSKAPSLLRKQAKRYQDIAGKIDELCRRMQGNDPCDPALSPEFRTQRQTEYLLEAIRLQQRAAETGQKLVALQAEISSAYAAGDELGSSTKIPTRRSLDCIRANFKEIQRNLEIWLARIVGDLEGILSRDGASRMKDYYVSRSHYV